MQMRYALTAVRSDIGYNPVSVGETLLLCHLGDDSEDIAYQFTVGSIHCIHRLDMLLGNRPADAPGATGLISLNTRTRSSSYTFADGISPAAILQNRQSIILAPFRKTVSIQSVLRTALVRTQHLLYQAGNLYKGLIDLEDVAGTAIALSGRPPPLPPTSEQISFTS